MYTLYTRLLTIDYQAVNGDASWITGIDVLGSHNTCGVYSIDILAAPGEPVMPGGNHPFTVRYLVPDGVEEFRTTVYLIAKDSCGNIYQYPGSWPGT
ncbi:MAG: hypothetical protein ACYC57_08450 [Thermoleophilia bacterium]